jgi:hypothetical protein
MNGKDKEGMVKPSVLLAKYLPFEATQGQKDFFIKMDEFFKEGASQIESKIHAVGSNGAGSKSYGKL